MTGSTSVSLDCETSVIILASVAGLYTVLNVALIVCIVWCACFRGKRKFQVRPLSPRNEYKSPSRNGYPRINTRTVLPQSESRVLATIAESSLQSDNGIIMTTFINNKDSPFISRNYNGNAGDEDYWQRDSPVLMTSNAWEEKAGGGDSASDDTGSVFINQSTGGSVVSLSEDIDGQSDSSSIHEARRAIVYRRNRAPPRRTDSTKPLLESESSTDISDTLYEEDSGFSSSPTQPTLANQMKVLTRHAGSRKNINRRTDSMRSLVGNMEEPYQSSTLPRLGRLPPLSHRSSLQTLTENTLSTDFSAATDFNTATLGRPVRSRARHPPERSHSLNIEAFATLERRKRPRKPIKVEAPVAPKWFSSQTSLNSSETSTPEAGLNQPQSPLATEFKSIKPGLNETKPKQSEETKSESTKPNSHVEEVSESSMRATPPTPRERPRPKVSSPLPPPDSPGLILGPPKARKTSAEKRRPKISSPLPPTESTVGKLKPQISSPDIVSPVLSNPTSPLENLPEKPTRISQIFLPGESSLQRISLNLTSDLEEKFKVLENKYRSEV